MVEDRMHYRTVWVIRRYASDEDYARGKASMVMGADWKWLPAESVIEGNMLLNEGIQALWNLACALSSPSPFSNANAYIGVGESSAGESAGHTGLQGSSKTYKAMEAGYPSRTNQTVTWRSVFGSADANYAWNELTVANGNSDAAINLNRKVSAQGTKASGQTWTVDLAITLS